MINLIPNQEKKKKVKDFYFRLGVVSLASLGMSAFFAILALIPAYYISVVEIKIANQKLEIQKNEPVPVVDQDSLKAMEELDRKLDIVEKAEKERNLLSQKVITEIVLEKMSGIKINRISYEEDAKDGKKVSIYGIAPSRERLLMFRRVLEDNVGFKQVDLPISNFIKGSNIEFYISLIPA